MPLHLGPVVETSLLMVTLEQVVVDLCGGCTDSGSDTLCLTCLPQREEPTVTITLVRKA